jgi:hypothetical protein
MTTLHDKSLFFIPAAAKARAGWLYRAPAKTTACTGETCTVDLPKSNSGKGCFKIQCEDCAAWALVSVAASVDDPMTFTMPCGRIRMNAEREQEQEEEQPR